MSPPTLDSRNKQGQPTGTQSTTRCVLQTLPPETSPNRRDVLVPAYAHEARMDEAVPLVSPLLRDALNEVLSQVEKTLRSHRKQAP